MKKHILFITASIALILMVSGAVFASGNKETSKSTGAAAVSGPFSWTRFKGQTIDLLLNKHGYTSSMLNDLSSFEKLTGIKVKYDIYPEEQYFDKVTTALSSGSSQYDIFMTGVYQVWQYAPPGWIQPLGKYINDPSVTNPNYDAKDFLPNLMAALRWDLKDGHKTGTGPQWALPWGFEEYTLMYNQKVFKSLNLEPPTTFAEVIKDGKLIEQKYPNMFGIACRGSRNWATIHPGFLTGLVSAGGGDFGPNLKPLVNDPTDVKYAEAFVNMMKQVGPPNWTTYTWYDVENALGAGKAAMGFDADILGFFADEPGATKESGNLAWTVGPGLNGPATKSNMWIWSLAMNNASKHKLPAWYWLQWATGKKFLTDGAVKYSLVDPVRKSVWDDAAFQHRIATFPGYLSTFKKINPDAAVYFTPESHFFELTTDWAAALQQIYAGANAQTALNTVAKTMNQAFGH